jgi:WD40 repeat protein
MFRAAVSIPSDDKCSRYIVGGAEHIVFASQTNNEVNIEKKQVTNEPVWNLVNFDGASKLAAVTGKGKPTKVFLTGNLFETSSTIFTAPFITSATAIGGNELFVSSTTEIAVINESGKIRVKKGFEHAITCATVQGEVAVVATGRGLCLTDLREAGHIVRISGIVDAHSMNVKAVAINANTLITGCEEGVIKVWDLRNFQGDAVHRVQDAHMHWVTNLSFGNSSKCFLSAGADCAVTVWSLDNGQIKNIQTNKLEDSIYAVAWSPSSARHFLAASFDGTFLSGKVPH